MFNSKQFKKAKQKFIVSCFFNQFSGKGKYFMGSKTFHYIFSLLTFLFFASFFQIFFCLQAQATETVDWHEYWYSEIPEVGTWWSYSFSEPTGLDDFTVNATPFQDGEFSGKYRLGDFIYPTDPLDPLIRWMIYEPFGNDLLVYHDLRGNDHDPPIQYPGIVPLETIMDYPDASISSWAKWYFKFMPPITVPAGTYNDIVALISLNTNFSPNSINNLLELDNTLVPYAVESVFIYARGIGMIAHTYVDLFTDEVQFSYELTDKGVQSFPISGSLSYAGSQTGTTIVAVFDNPGMSGPPVSIETLSVGLDFTISDLEAGEYYLAALIDINMNSLIDIGEPYGIYRENPVYVPPDTTGIDIVLEDYESIDSLNYLTEGVGQIGDSWRYSVIFPSGDPDFTADFTQIMSGEHAGRLRIGDYIINGYPSYEIFERSTDEILAYHILPNYDYDPPAIIPAASPLEIVFDSPVPEHIYTSKWYLKKLDTITLTSGTYNDILLNIMFYPDVPPNAANTYFDVESIPYGVSHAVWYARGIGEIMRASIDPVSGDVTYNYELIGNFTPLQIDNHSPIGYQSGPIAQQNRY